MISSEFLMEEFDKLNIKGNYMEENKERASTCSNSGEEDNNL